jgi:predicted Fe-S protein YdhL (DUF1289 family)
MTQATPSVARQEVAAVPSPCTNVCRMDDRTGWCEGCLRTIDEIVAWAAMSDTAKLEVWDQLAQRRAQCQADTAEAP